ncbi:MAG TPA: hypothetical protein VJN92_04175 [Candidatus Acidoferrum sp.]|nr:hypothetical protein [Candidatus Acidoferrum sp.]
MENRKGKYARLPESRKHAVPMFRCSSFFFSNKRVLRRESFTIVHFLIFIFIFISGCGAPGDPVPPSPPVPVAVSDLAAHQAGDGVELFFSLPPKTVSGEKLTAPPAVEILQGSLKPNGAPDPKSFRVVYTIPSAVVTNYLAAGYVRFTDPISPKETKAHPGTTYAYLIRTRLSKKRASADSNIVTTHLFPVPQSVSSAQLQVTENAVNLNWAVPTRTSAGDPLSGISGYRIYRGAIDPHAPALADRDLSAVHWISPLALLDSSTTNSYSDKKFEFGKTYVYSVRSVISVDGNEIESDNSEPVTVTPLDTFPPAAPQDLVAAVLPAEAPATFAVDLSWSINLETDFAGYRVYRSEQEGARGQLITPDLLPTPAFRDSSIVLGRHYWYAVTALDRAGNESAASSSVAVDIPQPPS